MSIEVVYKKTDDLIPYINNPRNNDEAVDKVAASIKEFGWKVPVVITTDNVIVTGHTRLKSAKKLGLETVPCIIADDLTDAQIKAFRLADNKVAEYSEWDFDKLKIELEGLTDIEMDDFGFDFDFGEDVNGYTRGSDQAEEDEDEFGDIEKLEKHYGVPYQGNKSRIADIIINLLPEGKRLVDLFGGGGVSLTAVCFRVSGMRIYTTT